MCGIAGFLGGAPQLGDEKALLRLMSDTLVHRGPDAAGVWSDTGTRIGLAHRRLSILDLSDAGHQPMVSASGRFVLAFNGEIYNHSSLREALGAGIAWRGHSDTETLLAGIEAWGIEATLSKAIGMFALAVWDRHTHVLTLARDRLGEKPLYYGWQGTGTHRAFLFGSELKALKKHPSFVAGVDRGALCLLLRHNYVPAPYSIYQGIAKLEPGCTLSLSLSAPEPSISRFWDALAIARARHATPFSGDAAEAVDVLESLAKDAVRQQMIADVPLGAFLSGGIDSSTVVALMQAQSPRPVKTFTIGFHEAGFNEAEHALAVARHLGTDHTELYVTPREALEVIPRLPEVYCEPFADSTQIPNLLLSQLARSQVTVSLSGDAGDELFCGYDRYQLTQKRWGKLNRLPEWLRTAAARGLRQLPGQDWKRRADLLACRSADELYWRDVSHTNDPAAWVIGGLEHPTWLHGRPIGLGHLHAMERMMVTDALSYLPDDILVKVDRAAMGVSLETRAPFLDHRLVEFSWTLPLDYKLRSGVPKWVLREVLYRHVPRELIDRPKRGFSVPMADWLRGPLREWAESLLSQSRLRREGFFHPDPVRQTWASHVSGNKDCSAQLWCVLMFQAWLDAHP